MKNEERHQGEYKMTTILDVEKKCGVSRSTISRYLNGRKVRPENRKKIERAIKELSFQRNPMASGLKSSKSFTVGCVIPNITDPFFPSIIKTFQEQMLEKGYQTNLNTYGNDLNLEIEQVKTLANKRVDGLVIATSNKTGSHIQACLDEGIPVIQIDRIIEGLACDSVTVDNYNAVFDAISLAIRKGHKNIGYIGGLDLYTENIRLRSFKDVLVEHDIELRDEYIVRAELVEHYAARQFMRLMNLLNPPTLIFCSNVYSALGALEAMLEYKVKVPKDVSVMTFDKLSSFPYYGFIQSIKPQFSSICQPSEKIGITTAELLLTRMRNGSRNYEPMDIKLKTSFYMTDSVADIARGESIQEGGKYMK